MILDILQNRPFKLFIFLGSFFITNVLIAEIIGVKIFQLEDTLGFAKWDYSLLGFEHLSLQYTCGVIIWPVVFIMTDIINEYYGKKGVRYLSMLAVVMTIFTFFSFRLAILSSPADWWVGSNQTIGVPDMNAAYKGIVGQSNNIILGSITAFLISQILDIYIFTKIKKITGEKSIWLRATGSTLVSQLIDSFVVLYIAFYIGGNWTLQQVMAIGINNYIYKASMAVILTPLLYLVHFFIQKYIGKDKTHEMQAQALHT